MSVTRLVTPGDAPALAELVRVNRDFPAPWEPVRSEDYFTAGGQRTRGCEWLAIETQNVNAAACHFYRKMGCTLGAIDRLTYPGLPGEAQLVWWRGLAAPREP